MKVLIFVDKVGDASENEMSFALRECERESERDHKMAKFLIPALTIQKGS